MRKVVMNKHNNLLQLEEHFYQLVDVDEPNTFRNLFPYEEIPKIAFNDRIVPHNMPDDIWITDTTFRDGQQSRAPYTTDQIVTIYDYLHKLGGPKGIIRQSEFFLYSKKDRSYSIRTAFLQFRILNFINRLINEKLFVYIQFLDIGLSF